LAADILAPLDFFAIVPCAEGHSIKACPNRISCPKRLVYRYLLPSFPGQAIMTNDPRLLASPENHSQLHGRVISYAQA
jgi:hypothetical protein